jgi:hypothetical protein
MPDISAIPGITMLGYGYDVFASAYCDEDVRKGDDNGDSLLSGLDLAGGSSSIVTVLQHEYRCPNLFKVLSEQPKNDDYTIFATTVEEYTSQLTVKAQVGADIGGFSGSVSSSYTSSMSSYLKNTYGEHGHVYSGITVQLPLSADQLRAHLKDHVKTDLETLSPAAVIRKYGTHLVSSVMIGGKALLRQYSSQSDVTNSTEWSVALKASYDNVTASSSVDETTTKTQQTFRMSMDVHTLGGTVNIVNSSNQFQAWLNSIDRQPAIIDMTGVVPLWQLLEPGSAARKALQKVILQRARLYQPGGLFGTMDYSSSMDSREPLHPSGVSSGQPSIGRQVTAGWGMVWNAQDTHQGNGFLCLWLSTGQENTSEPRFAVYGGRQTASNGSSSAPFLEIYQWGKRQTPSGIALTEIVIFEAYTAEGPYAQGPASPDNQSSYSKVSLFVGPMEDAEPGSSVIRGGHTLNAIGPGGSGWGLSPQSNPEINFTDQLIYRSIMWTGNGDWGMGSVYFYLEPVVTALAEVGGDGA